MLDLRGALAVVGIDVVIGLTCVSAVLLVAGVVRRRRAGHPESAQIVAPIVFSALAVAAIHTDVRLGCLLVGVGLIGHALWDLRHYRDDVVVPRSVAAFCGVLDTSVGAAVLWVAVVAT